MNGSKDNLRVPGHDGFGAIAVVRVEIPDPDAPDAVRDSFKRGDGDVAEKTKPHGLVACRVVSGRAHETESLAPLHRDVRGGDGCSGRAGCVLVNAGVGR